MSTRHLLHPELLLITEINFEFDLTAEALPAIRESRDRMLSLAEPDERVKRSEILIDVPDGNVSRNLLYQPTRSEGRHPAYLHIHGGGYIMGTPVASDPMNLMICSRLGVTVLSVGYRLAPENKADQALADCYAGLAWLHANADELNIDPARIAIGGESAGGGLAAALAIEARDRGELAICHQHLTYPMLDDRTGSAEQPGDPLTGEFIWNREKNQFGWQSFLGDLPRSAPWVPARVENFDGLPSTWMFTATMDLFRDENIDYARKLMEAGIRCELLVEPGACHGFQMIPGTSLAAKYVDAHLRGLSAGLAS